MGKKKNTVSQIKYQKQKEAAKNLENTAVQQNAETSEEILSELLYVNELILKYLPEKQGSFCYILSMKWFETWCNYTGYYNLQKQQDPQKNKLFGKRRPQKINNDLLSHSQKYQPIAPQLKEYTYLSISLREDLQHYKDFMIICAQLSGYLFAKYDGIQIQRGIRFHKKQPIIDIHLHSVYICTLSDQQICNMNQLKEFKIQEKYQSILPIQKIQISGLWNTDDLKTFLTKLIKCKYQLKDLPNLSLWKIHNYLSTINCQKKLIQKLQQNYCIPGKPLQSKNIMKLEVRDFIKNSQIILVHFGLKKLSPQDPQKIIEGNCQQCLEQKILEFTCKSCTGNVYYCSQKCKYQDKKYHQKVCQECYYDSDDELDDKLNYSQIKCGLVNLGNTCYMNASLQCLLNLEQFIKYFISNKYLQNLDKKELEQNKGIFIKKFCKFIKKATQSETFAPWSLKTQISYFINIFKGYSQHDANDFLVYLIATLSDFSSKNNGCDYPQFIINTFLGWYKSYVICPECCLQSTTRDPFLQISLPIKSKIPIKKYTYTLIKSWNRYESGTFQVKDTWEQIFKSLGFNPNFKKLVGSQGSKCQQIIEETPEEIYNKYKKEHLIIYPSVPIGNTVEITIILSYTKLLAGNQAKCNYGFPIFINIDQDCPTSMIYDIVAKTLFSQQETKLNQFQCLLTNFQIEYSELCKKEQQQNKNKNKQILQQSIIEEIHKILDFRLLLFTTRRGKKSTCQYCHKKCNNCILPFSLNNKIIDFIKLADNFKLELLYNYANTIENVQEKKQKNSQQNPFITLQECIQEFSKPEQLDQQNLWYCHRCNEMRLAYKQLRIQTYPKILMLHLKRFKDQNGKKVKNTETVAYPQILELEGNTYCLNSIVIHQGSLQGGHYWSICKKSTGYITFNDEIYENIDNKEYFHKNAYILFYNKQI